MIVSLLPVSGLIQKMIGVSVVASFRIFVGGKTHSHVLPQQSSLASFGGVDTVTRNWRLGSVSTIILASPFAPC